MTPQEKCKQLVEAFFDPTRNWIEISSAKECARITIEEMLQIHGSSLHQDFWQEVKKELESF
jgi:hypothetical protein